MRNAIVAMLAAAGSASLSCGTTVIVKRYHGPADQPVYQVRIWIEDDPRMPKEVVLKGCREWNAKGVECLTVSEEALSDIRVYADDGACVEKDDKGTKDPKDDETHVYLAWAHHGGKVRMMTKCLDTKGGKLEPHQLAAVVTHEVGHQLGIWEHVPYAHECAKAATHPDGKKVCGDAVMNPHYHAKVDVVTEIDALAFDLRDDFYSVLVSDRPRPPPSDEPLCRYPRGP
jgi:hypothetical protein